MKNTEKSWSSRVVKFALVYTTKPYKIYVKVLTDTFSHTYGINFYFWSTHHLLHPDRASFAILNFVIVHLFLICSIILPLINSALASTPSIVSGSNPHF